MSFNVVRRIRAPLDYLIMRPLDTSQVVATMSSTNIAVVSWLMPVIPLSTQMHKRYEVERIAEAPNGDETMSLGLVTMLIGTHKPANSSFIERVIDPGPHTSISLRVSVMDRVHWQRSVWNDHSICKSFFWGTVPKRVFGIHMDSSAPVKVDARFNDKLNRYEKYSVSVPKYNIEIELEDTGNSILSPDSPVVPGFLDNESALRQLALSREVCMKGIGGCVYRQTLWSTPSLPNVARVTRCEVSDYFRDRFGFEAVVPEPVAAWVLDEVPETKVYQIEAQVESENDPHTATHFGDRSLHERVQKKAMNRFQGFRDDVRSRAYSDKDESEMPR